MAMNRIQFQQGMSFFEHFQHFQHFLRIPRHSATYSTNIRPAIPPAFGHPFHDHSAGAVGAERRRRG
ncbi:MAG: hypothetical protein EOM91_14240 [Sphingobacteriia bacterium]|nr:hypothetical protein [Sphingobacteriia bacterium]